MVLIFISLIMSDVEHLFMCFLAICMSSLEKKKSLKRNTVDMGDRVLWGWVGELGWGEEW